MSAGVGATCGLVEAKNESVTVVDNVNVEDTPVPAKVLSSVSGSNRTRRRRRNRKKKKKQALQNSGVSTPLVLHESKVHNVELKLILHQDRVVLHYVKPYIRNEDSVGELLTACFRVRVVQRCMYLHITTLLRATKACIVSLGDEKRIQPLIAALQQNEAAMEEIVGAIHILWCALVNGQDLDCVVLKYILPACADRLGRLLIGLNMYAKDIPDHFGTEMNLAGERFIKSVYLWYHALDVFCIHGARASSFSTMEKSYVVHHGLCLLKSARQCQKAMCAIDICAEIAGEIGIPLDSVVRTVVVTLESFANPAGEVPP